MKIVAAGVAWMMLGFWTTQSRVKFSIPVPNMHRSTDKLIRSFWSFAVEIVSDPDVTSQPPPYFRSFVAGMSVLPFVVIVSDTISYPPLWTYPISRPSELGIPRAVCLGLRRLTSCSCTRKTLHSGKQDQNLDLWVWYLDWTLLISPV